MKVEQRTLYPPIQVRDSSGNIVDNFGGGTPGEPLDVEINTMGDPVSVQNPLQTDGDSVYIKDVWKDESLVTGWLTSTGTQSQDNAYIPFNNLHTTITNSTSDNPKILRIHFNRTLNAQQAGLGAITGDYSNVKISLLGSSGVLRTILDDSANNEKRSSFNYPFEPQLFNAIQLYFYTSDPVTLSNIAIQKATTVDATLKGLNPNGVTNFVRTNLLGNLLVSLDEQKDAFGRLKVAEPFSVFDNSLTSPNSDILFWSSLTNGTASGLYDRNTSKYTLSVAATGDYLVRQTKMRFKYQPGRSHEFLITGNWSTETGIRKRAGLVDYDNVGLATVTNAPQNGVFFENNGGVVSWNIANNGTTLETVTQENWNLDKADGTGRTGFTFNPDSTNILACQLEWLGVGVVLVGFAVGAGSIVYVHAFQHAGQSAFQDVYMRTANLPVAYEITSIAGTGSMKQICSSVISGGGFNPVGINNSVQNSGGGVAITAGVSELLCGIKLKEDSFEYTIEPTDVEVLSTNKADTLWVLCINPTYTGTVTFTDLANSVCQEAYNNNNVVTDFGIVVSQGSISEKSKGSGKSLDSAVKIGKTLIGELDELWLIATPIGANDTYWGTINFKELI